MDPHTPPSPSDPSSSRFDGGLPSGFNELLQHNNAVAAAATTATTPTPTTTTTPSSSYPREIGGPLSSSSLAEQATTNQVRSQPTSRYGTPIPQLHRPHTFDSNNSIMQYQQQQQQRPGSAQLPGYRTNMYPHDSSPYGPIPETTQTYSTPATSPPTPSRASDLLTTRSGNIIHRNTGTSNTLGPKSSRIEKSGSNTTAANKKKRKADKTGLAGGGGGGKPAKNVPQLEKPMSQITLDVDVPVANIDEYVNRSSEVRRQEVEMGKNPGRIKRPMNAFMLYRKAYQLRAKEWASQHNHQVVSRVCGLSWPMEPEHVREQFKAWAETERDNHQKAHPDYKFTPSKPAAKPNNVKSPNSQSQQQQQHFNHSDGSDLDDLDWTPGPGIRSSAAAAYASHHHHHHPQDMRHIRTPDIVDDYYNNTGSIYGPPPGYHTHASQLGDMRGLGGMGGGRAGGYDFATGKLSSSSPYDPRDQGLSGVGGYYEHNNSRLSNHSRQLTAGMVEDVMITTSKGLQSPSSVFHQTHHLYPSQYHDQSSHSQSQPQTHRGGGGSTFEPRIDPSLMFDNPGNTGMNSMLLETGLSHHHQQQQQHPGHSQHHHQQQHQSQHQHNQWQGPDQDISVSVIGGGNNSATGAGTGTAAGGSGAYSNAFSLGLDETLSIDHQSTMEQQAQLLRGHPGEWHREELADTEQFDLGWMDPSPTSGVKDER